MTESDLIQRAKAALEGTTDGPWDVVPGAWGNVWHFSDDPGSPPLIVRKGGMKQPDAEFIAQARTLVPELVAEVERLREGIERVRDVVHEHATRGIGQRILDALVVSDE